MKREPPPGSFHTPLMPGTPAASRSSHSAERGRLADGDHHRAMLAACPPFLADEVRMLSRLDEDRQRAAIAHRDPVGARIDPVAVGVLGDHHAFGAYMLPAIVGVPFRR